MYDFTRDEDNIDSLRRRLARMSDEELVRYGKAAAFMAGQSDRETWRVQLEEARAEWRRRAGRVG